MIGGGVADGDPNAAGSCGGTAGTGGIASDCGVAVAAGCDGAPPVAGDCVGAAGFASGFSGASNGTV
jgi:hypothetical protein